MSKNERIEMEAQPLNNNAVKIEVMTGSNGNNPITVTKEKALPLGLTKEELLKYANDPFWVKLRRTLFALFWLIWLSMFLGAFLIVHYYPACAPSSKLRWFQRGTCLQVNRDLFDEPSLQNHIPSIVNTFPADSVILPYRLHASELNDQFGNMTELKRIANELKTQNAKRQLLIDLELGTTSAENKWFKAFLKNESHYQHFYVELDKNAQLPNEFEFVKISNRYILQKSNGRPVLNLNNERVLNAIANQLRDLTSKGISGYRLLDAPYPLSKPNNTNQLTYDDKLNEILIERLTRLIKSVKSDAVLILQLPSKYNEPKLQTKYYGDEKKPTVDSIVNTVIADLSLPLNGNRLVTELKNVLEQKVSWSVEGLNQGPWTSWLIDDSASGNQFNKHCIRNVIGYLLPRGTPINSVDKSYVNQLTNGNLGFDLNSMLNNGSLSKHPSVQLMQKLRELRAKHSDVLLLGAYEFPHVDDNVIVLARYSSLVKEGFLAIINLDSRKQTFRLDAKDYLPEEARVQLTCESIRAFDTTVQLRQPIHLEPNEILVLSFNN